MNTRSILPLLTVALLQLAVLPALAQQNDVPRLINYQGQLLIDGEPATGTHSFSFALYDQENGGNELWSEPAHQQTVQNGVFSVMVGRNNAIPADVFDAEELYLSVSHEGTEIDRVRLLSTPYAIRAARADRAVLAEDVEDGTITASKLDDDAAVLSLNDRTGALTIDGGGAAEVSENGNTITISVDEIGGIQLVDTDGETIGGDGVDSPITLLDDAVTTGKLQDGAVDDDKLANGTAVRSLNNLTDGVELTEGNNITISTNSGQGTIQISAETGDGGGLTEVVTADPVVGDGTSPGNAVTIGSESITAAHLADEAVTNDKIQDGAIDEDKLANGAVVLSLEGETGDIQLEEGNDIEIEADDGVITISVEDDDDDDDDGAGVSNLNGQTGQVTITSDGTLAIGDPGGSTITIDVASGAITSDHLAEDAVTSLHLAANAVTSEHLAAGAVTAEELAEEAVTGDELAPGAAVLSLSADDATLQDDVTLAEGTGIELEADAGTGTITIVNTGNQPSSIRFKENVVPIVDAMHLIEQLQGVRYEWREDGRQDVGLIAEEVHEVLPELVSYEEDGTTVRGLNYGKLVSVLVEAAKEQQETIDRQQETIDEMERRLERLERLVAETSTDTERNAGTERQ